MFFNFRQEINCKNKKLTKSKDNDSSKHSKQMTQNNGKTFKNITNMLILITKHFNWNYQQKIFVIPRKIKAKDDLFHIKTFVLINFFFNEKFNCHSNLYKYIMCKQITATLNDFN